MMASFCKGILEIRSAEGPLNLDVLYGMRRIYAKLKDARAGNHDASDMCRFIKDFDGRPISIYEQKDADEFFNLLMDRLELDLKKTNRPDLLKDIFGGAFANDVICIGCPHRSTVIEQFFTLNLQIHNKKNVNDALNSYIESENLSGGNAYHCEKCDKKVDAKKRVSLGTLPNVLVIPLKRFEFDYMKKYF